MERRLAVLARATRREVTALVTVASMATSLFAGSALAAPKRKDARKHFDRGVKLYTKKDYAGARDALQASALLEPDVETLFAWAQTERQLGNCGKAIELYEQLLDMPMPTANKQAIRPKIEECKKILAAQQPPPPPEPVEPEPVEPPKPVEPAPRPAEPKSVATTPPLEPERREDPRDDRRERSRDDDKDSWSLKHPIGGALLGIGAGGLVVGGYLLYVGRQADLDAKAATNYFEYIRYRDEAERQGTRGVVALSIGGAFAVAGIIWYATRSNESNTTQVSGWVAPDGGGLVAAGRF